jgi:hypothetical protein
MFMIDPHWSVVDLDPITWRNLGRFIEPQQYVRAAQPGEHGLFVLHDAGRLLRVVDTDVGLRRDLVAARVADPAGLARELYERGEWQRVHVIDRRHLANVARQAQATPQRDLTLDQYYHLVYNLVWDHSDGYISIPPHPGHWNGLTYADVTAFFAALPDAAAVALGVLDGERLAIGLILDVRGGLIRTVTTFEALSFPIPAFELGQSSFERLWALLEQRGASGAALPAAALLCSATVFEEWIASRDKASVLGRAAQQGQAFWRVIVGSEENTVADGDDSA